MQGHPPSSARPSTSGRPTTAFDRDQFQQHQQRLQQQPFEIEEEYEEESDDEDVFAFLPPTTADQEQQQHQPFFTQSNHVQYPEPTFDPWGRQYPVAASSKNPFAIDHNTQYASTSPPQAGSLHALPPGIHGAHPHPYIQQSTLPPPSPSSDSHPSTGMTGPDLYRLKRLGTAVSSKLSAGAKAGEEVDDKENEQEQGGDDTRKEDENRAVEEGDADSDCADNKDRETCESDTATSQKDYNNNSFGRSGRRQRTISSQDFEHVVNPHNADTERDAGLYRRSIATSASKGKRCSRTSEGGVSTGIKPNQNAQPYTMYSQQATSYYGKDVRGMWSFFFSL